MSAPLTPNLYTLETDDGVRLGLHRFRDGEVTILRQHRCGDWQTLRPATKADVEGFEKYGSRVTGR